MAKLPTYEEMGKKVAEEVLDGYIYKGKTLREWIDILAQTRWIPVSERLPEIQDCYLVTTKWKGSYSGDVYIETNMAVYRERPKEWDCKDVIAWMPLPEPYKEGKDESDSV